MTRFELRTSATALQAEPQPLPNLTENLHRNQCDQIGLFLKSLGDNFSWKSSSNIGQLFEAIL